MPAAANSLTTDSAALAGLYRSWHEVVTREASRILGDHDDAADVAQVVFARLLASGGWTAIRNPEAYFRGAARSEAHRLRERLARRTEMPELPDSGPGPLESIARREFADAVRAALGTLPHRCRRVMVLTIIEEYRASEVADDCDMSLAGVRKARTRGYAGLRGWFAGRGGADVWAALLDGEG